MKYNLTCKTKNNKKIIFIIFKIKKSNWNQF